MQAGQETLQEHLLKQIPLSDLDEKGREIAEMIVGGINDDGYFLGSFADIAMVSGVDEKRVGARRVVGIASRKQLFSKTHTALRWGCRFRHHYIVIRREMQEAGAFPPQIGAKKAKIPLDKPPPSCYNTPC